MKLSAFYRLLKRFPAPVMPLFIDNAGNYYFHTLDKNGMISSFHETGQLDKERIIISSLQQDVEANVGSNGIYAIEHKPKQVKSATSKKELERTATKLHRDGAFRESPFTLLEIAAIAEADDLIVEALIQCRTRFRKYGRLLLGKWIDGLDIDASLLDRAGFATEEETQEIHFSFASSYSALVNLTEFSRKYLHEYRDKTFRRAIEGLIDKREIIIDRVSLQKVYDYFLRSAPKTEGDEDKEINLVYNVHLSKHRGNIKIRKDDYKILQTAVYGYKPELSLPIMDMNRFERMIISSFFLQGRSELFITLMYVHYMSQYEEFENFISSRDFIDSV